MNKTKVLIVEDSDDNIQYLTTLFHTYFKDLEIVGVANNAVKAYELILLTNPQIIILDIELNNGTGFDVLEKLDGDGDYQFIACTSHKDYAMECFGHNVVDFLLKPFKLEDLNSSITKAKKQLDLVNDFGAYNGVLPVKKFTKYLALTSSKEAVIIKPSDIEYLKADGRYTSVFLKSGKEHVITRNIGVFEKLIDPSEFFRVHHSFIVNLNEVLSIDRPKTTYCLLKSGNKIPVSIRKASNLISYLHLKG